MKIIQGYKLLTLHKDGSLSPLFIDKKLRIPIGEWQIAKSVPTKGFAFRPGFHACSQPIAPHLSTKGRIWCRVSLRDIKEFQRPSKQGGLWYIANYLRIDEILRNS